MVATAYTGKTASQEVGAAAGKKVRIIASFYPLYDFASHVAGDKADVSSLVPAGVEPHDWEPTTADVLRAKSADLLVINGAGFESWADSIGARMVINTSEGLELDVDNDEEPDHDGVDPHVWLDPVLAKHQVESIRAALAQVDPENAAYYNENAAKFTARLDSLDQFIRSELSSCEKTDFIAFHDAFSRFAARYGLVQHGVHGISPEGEILPQRIQEVIELANSLGINTIYSEELVDNRLAEVIASEIPQGRVLVLSPLEGIDRDEAASGIGYIEKMQQNVANLKEGLKCT
jgi:zinc transport system substrate-binding protein